LIQVQIEQTQKEKRKRKQKIKKINEIQISPQSFPSSIQFSFNLFFLTLFFGLLSLSFFSFTKTFNFFLS